MSDGDHAPWGLQDSGMVASDRGRDDVQWAGCEPLEAARQQIKEQRSTIEKLSLRLTREMARGEMLAQAVKVASSMFASEGLKAALEKWERLA